MDTDDGHAMMGDLVIMLQEGPGDLPVRSLYNITGTEKGEFLADLRRQDAAVKNMEPGQKGQKLLLDIGRSFCWI